MRIPRLRRPVAVATMAATAGALVAGTLVAVPSLAAPVTVPQVPRSGISFNGPVYAVALGTDVVYVGGAFTSVTGTNGTFPRARLAAVDLTTGAVRTFRADANGRVRALALSGSALFVGGEFTTIGGVARARLAEVAASTGAPASTRRDANGAVLALAADDGRLYVGGEFTTLGGVPRSRVAALRLDTRAVDAGFTASVDATVRAVAPAPGGSSVFVGGDFRTVNGRAHRFLASLTTTGAVNAPVFALGTDNPVLSLDTNDTATRVFAGVGGDITGNQVAAFNPSTGARLWFQRADGDVQAVAHHAGNVFFGFHEGFGGSTSVRLLAADAATGALEPAFRPTMNSFWGVWALAASSRGVVAGGEFTVVSGTPAGRLALFASAPATPPPPPPVEPGAEATSFALVGPSPSVVVVRARGRQSSIPTARVVWIRPAGSPPAAVTVVGSRRPAVGSAASSVMRFRPVCGSTASCVLNGTTSTVTFGLALAGRTGTSLGGNAPTALRSPGTYAFRPVVTSADGTVRTYAGPPVEVRFLRATRITRFGAAPEPVPAGRRVSVSGTVTKATICPAVNRPVGCRKGQLGRWTAVKNRTVRLFFDPAGPAPRQLVATVTTDRQGRFSARLRQDVTGSWSAERAAMSTFAGSRSSSDRVRVTP